VDGAEVYGLILDGELPAANGNDGLVYVTSEALEEFHRHAPTPQWRTPRATVRDFP
jgi:hypothetical protein